MFDTGYEDVRAGGDASRNNTFVMILERSQSEVLKCRQKRNMEHLRYVAYVFYTGCSLRRYGPAEMRVGPCGNTVVIRKASV